MRIAITRSFSTDENAEFLWLIGEFHMLIYGLCAVANTVARSWRPVWLTTAIKSLYLCDTIVPLNLEWSVNFWHGGWHVSGRRPIGLAIFKTL